MAQKKIIKNQSGETRRIVNREVPDMGQLDVQPIFWLDMSIDTELQDYVSTGDYVINDGVNDLPIDLALAHLENQSGIVFEHNDITLLPAVGENAPEIAKISNSLVGHCLLVGEEIFGQTRIDNLAGGEVVFQMHLAINNTTADRWVKYELSYFTTSGHDEKPCNTPDGVVTIGPVEVPTTAFGVFEVHAAIPETAWENGERYMFVGVKRVTATGKTAPTNHPITLRYCKQYYKRLEV